MKTALVLAGHGSHISPDTAGLVWGHVDHVRALGVVDEVTAAFWKEAPSFHTVFDTLEADDITVVPLFTAQGYFTQTVIPAEMGLEGALTQRQGKIIRYARTLSEHPYLNNVARLRVQEAVQTLGVPSDQIAVAVIGHSTRRNPESRKATEAQADLIRELGVAAQVEAVYLDDSPAIADLYRLTTAPYLIAMPYFLALGSHTTIDVPAELGLQPGQTEGQVNGRTVYYTAPVGTGSMLFHAVLALARAAGTPMSKPDEIGTRWDGFPTAGREAFVYFIQQQIEHDGIAQFGELVFTPGEVKAQASAGVLQTLNDPADLRQWTRENPFRSLVTARGLKGGWRIPIENPHQFHAVAETVYPGAVADWAAQQAGTFQPNTFANTIARQTGNYRPLAALTHSQQEQVVGQVCAGCLRHPTWFHGVSPTGVIPCPEPCNHWLSAAVSLVEEPEA